MTTHHRLVGRIKCLVEVDVPVRIELSSGYPGLFLSLLPG
ncbi:hypothetical protein ASZ90_015815 [hydrocarbon metagenome]|uniref:Uncharacterized protein n=1 Tax=hydrocarbon metagenome TaxID=938273 RepID=A0A0W8F142_9ZZZZ